MPNPYPFRVVSTTVVASPALAAETTIATIVIPSVGDPNTSIGFTAWVAMTIGTGGVSVWLRLRRGNQAGNSIADNNIVTGGIAAGNRVTLNLEGEDTPGEVAAQTYTLTATVGGASTASTVYALRLRAEVVG